MTKHQFGVYTVNQHFQGNAEPVPSLLLQQGEQETKENKETIILSWWDNILLQEGIYLILQLFL